MIALTQEKREELIKYYGTLIDWHKDRLSSYLSDFDRGAIESSKLMTEIALASLTAEPAYYVFKHPNGKLFHSLVDESCKGHNDVYPVFTAPPMPEIIDIESDVKNIIQLLSGREWAEHCTSTELGKELESQITDLYNEVSKIKLPDRDKLPGWARNHEDSLDWYESEIKRLNGLGDNS